MAEEIVLCAQNVTKSFNGRMSAPILRGIDLQVAAGETVAIIGRSGQGKTTLLHLLGALDAPTNGLLTIMGEKVGLWNRSKLRRRYLGFVFQAFHLLEDETALQNVLMPMGLARKSVAKGSVASQRAHALLEAMGLAEQKERMARLLSGGEKQRVALARALITQPRLILADEPSGNLDKQTAADVHQLLLQAASRDNIALVIVTHDENLAKLCSRTMLLQNGLLSQ